MLHAVDPEACQVVEHLLVTHPEDEVLGVLGEALRLAPLGRLLLIRRPLQQLARLSVDVHLLQVETHTLDVRLTAISQHRVELVVAVAPVEVDAPLMQVWQDHKSTSLQLCLVANYVRQTVVEAGLQRRSRLDGGVLTDG